RNRTGKIRVTDLAESRTRSLSLRRSRHCLRCARQTISRSPPG
ncbi:unnamed protein product, partial [Linum tenue]